VRRPEQPLTLTVRRGGKPPKGEPHGKLTGGEMIEVTLPPHPMRTLGLVMQMGKVVAVQENSPAAEAGIEADDFIDSIRPASDAPGAPEAISRDPIKLPEDLRRLAEQNGEVRITLRPGGRSGDGKQPTKELVVSLRKVTTYEAPVAVEDPVAAPALGIAYRVLSVVDRVEPGSPAEKAGLRGDDVVLKAQFLYPKDMKDKPKSEPIELSQSDEDELASWARLIWALQDMPPGTRIKLTYKRDEVTRTAVLTPVVAEEYFVPERGLMFEMISRTRIAETWGEAVTRGYDETVRSLGMVYRFLNKLGTGQVPVTMLGGPVTIAQVAGFSAFEGVGKLLLFLTMLSANLAVINFLPIPLLDGGHMVFLAWEGIRGRPAGERLVVALHTIGFVFIITLMLFVVSLDLRRLFFA
jgi:regulator of sigma E protease